MPNLWNLIFLHPILNALIGLDRLTGNLGWAIVIMTVLLRFIMTPLILPSLRISKKMQELQPELNKLKDRYKDDKQKLALAQAELYKQHGANPASGCLPQILQLVILVALYNALNSVLKVEPDKLISHLNPLLYSFNQLPSGFHLSTNFFYMNLVKPDLFHITGLPLPVPGLFLLLAAAVQFLSSKMMSPVISAEQKIAQKTSSDTDDAMVQMQQQMLFMFPLMTIVFGYQFPAGLVLYWFIFSFVSLFQQYYATGWGGLAPLLKKVNLLKS